jgi:hypothetical protein
VLTKRWEKKRRTPAGWIGHEPWKGEIGPTLSKSKPRHRPEMEGEGLGRVVAAMSRTNHGRKSSDIAKAHLESRQVAKIRGPIYDGSRSKAFDRPVQFQPPS